MNTTLTLNKAIQNLSKAIQIKTISNRPGRVPDYQPFDDFIVFLKEAYPICHEHLEHTRVNNYGLVYRLKGKNRDAEPLLFLGHYDVVPTAPGSESKWTYPPFSGTVADDYIWGRGALDDKFQIIALFEALERFITMEQQPERDVYLAFGFDEEVGGNLGASRIASFFKSQNIQFDCVLDEGGMCIEDLFPQINRPMATVGVGEKGQANLRVTFSQKGGHSAVPSPGSAIYQLSRLLVSIEDHPMPPHLTEPIKQLLKKVSPDVHGKRRRFYDHIELLKPALYKELSKVPMTNAMIRSTIAPTILQGSDMANVLPGEASAILNCRILQGDTVEDMIRHITRLCGKKKPDFEILMNHPPSAFSETDTQAYRHLEACISVIFPGAETTPTISLGGTDARKYDIVSKNIYRFTPVQVTKSERDAMHNINERISIENLGRAITFYTTFIQNYR